MQNATIFQVVDFKRNYFVLISYLLRRRRVKTYLN
jgi:hypothetical protein